MDEEERARREAVRLKIPRAELLRMNDRALARRARKMIEQGWLEEGPDHALRLTAQGEKQLAHVAPELLQRILLREGRLKP